MDEELREFLLKTGDRIEKGELTHLEEWNFKMWVGMGCKR